MSLQASFVFTRGKGEFRLRVDADLAPGITILFGPSGCGKTTTLMCLAGILAPQSGQISLDGQVLDDPGRGWHVPPRQRHLGYAPQRPALFPHLRVQENVLFGAPKMLEGVGRELLELLELTGLERRFPRDLSGGQSKRVSLARALVRPSRLVLLDEPLTGLEEPLRQRLRRFLREHQHLRQVPTVLVTHDLADALATADRVILYDQGRTMREVSPSQLKGAWTGPNL